MGHLAALALVLAGAASIFLYAGDLDSAQNHTDLSVSYAEANSLGPLVTIGQGRQAELAILRGDAKAGVRDLQQTLERLHAARHEVLTTEFNIALAQGLVALGRPDDGKALIDASIRQVESSGEMYYMPELLRVKGCVLLSMDEADIREGEICFEKSLALSRRQGARAWELRTAHDLAKFLAERGQAEGGRKTLQSIYAEFNEGYDTADLRAARQLLAKLS
jgi:predicted ATPase